MIPKKDMNSGKAAIALEMFPLDINPIKAPSINILYFPNSGLIFHKFAFTGTLDFYQLI